MSLYASILTWSRRRPEWQRDALRRLAGGIPLTEDDVADLARLCLARHGLVDGDAPRPLPLGPADLPLRGDASRRVVLTALADAVNVNALAPGQALPFRPVGLTVVCGRNGSGKSGYARILKAACRARGERERILGNVMERTVETPSATVRYGVDDEARVHAWRAGEASPDALAEINVFDARTAPVFVDGRTDLAWRPGGLALLDGLAAACDRVRARLLVALQRMCADAPPLPDVPPQSEAARLLDEVSAGGPPERVRERLAFTAADAAELERVERALAETSDRRRRELYEEMQRLETLQLRMARIEEALADDAVAALRAECEAGRSEPERSELGRSEPVCPTCGQPLPGVARDRAGAAHSDRVVAFDSDPWPAVPADARGRVGGDAARQRADAFPARRRVESLDLPDRREWLDVADLKNPEIEIWMEQAVARRAWLLDAAARGDWSAPAPPLPAGPSLDEALLAVDSDLERVSWSEWSDERFALAARRDVLRGRRLLAAHAEDILARLAWQAARGKLQAALRDCDSAPVTRAAVRFSREAATETLRCAFAVEVDRLQLSALGAALDPTRASKGRAYSHMRLHSPTGEEVAPGLVASEGEHRCLALAAFLAELSAAGNRSGMVFDDPVASLDDERRRAVAARLAAEAAERQVIVFTHDVRFAGDLRAEAERRGVPWSALQLRREGGRAGFCAPGLPADASEALRMAG